MGMGSYEVKLTFSKIFGIIFVNTLSTYTYYIDAVPASPGKLSVRAGPHSSVPPNNFPHSPQTNRTVASMSATENEAPDVPIASAATSNAEKTGDKLLPAKAGKTAAKAKKKGTAKRKDKNKPKRPLSAYNYFFKEERKRMLAILRGEKGAVNDPKSKNYVPEETLKILLDKKGHVVFPEMAKVVASHWKNVGDEEGARLRALAKEDLDRYNKEMQKYQLQEIPSPPQPHALADQMGRQGAQYAAPYGAYPTDVALAAPHYMMPMAPMMHQPQHAAGAYSYHPHEAAGGYHHPSLLGSPNMYYGGGPSHSPPGGPYGAVQYR